jgi:hypothetical protein
VKEATARTLGRKADIMTHPLSAARQYRNERCAGLPMPRLSAILRLHDMIEAAERARGVLGDMSTDEVPASPCRRDKSLR